MDIKKETPITVQSFHYDLNQKSQMQDQVNVALSPAYPDDAPTSGKTDYYQVSVLFQVAPDPGQFTVSGEISQIVQLAGYYGDGQDLTAQEYQLLSRPLVEYIETLTYEVTQVTLDHPVNLNFTANFK